MPVFIKIDATATNSSIEMKCGEALAFSYQSRSTAGVVDSLAQDEFVFAVYEGGTRGEYGYYNGVKSRDDKGDIALWVLPGTESEKLYGSNNLKWEIARRNDDGREVIAQGTLTIGESAPRIDDLNSAPVVRYINKIVRSNDPDTLAEPKFAVAMAAYVPAALTTLSTLTLSASTVVENTASGSVVGALQGRTAGSALSLFNDAGGRFALSGTNILVGLTATDYETASSHPIVVRETLNGVTKDNTLTITVSNVFEKPNLGTLTFSATSFTTGTASSGTINGATAGSAIIATNLPSGLTINSTARTWAWSGNGIAGTTAVTLTESLADSANSPKGSTVSITVTASILPIVLAFAGSSSPAQYLESGTGGTANSNVTASDDGVNYSTLTAGRFGVEAGTAIYAGTNRPVRFIRAGAGGTTLGGWEADGSGNRSTLVYRINQAKNAGNTVNGVLLQVGYNDLNNSTSTAQRLGLIRSLISKIRTETGLPNLTFFIGITQDHPSYPDGLRYQREAEMIVADTDANVRFGFNTYDLPTSDNTHQTEASNVISGKRFAAQVVSYVNGTTPSRAAKFSASSPVSVTQTDVTVTHNAGSDFTPASGIAGFRLFTLGGSEVSISAAVRQSATVVRLTHADIGTAGGSLIYNPNALAGDDATTPHDNSALTLPFEVTQTSLSLAATSVGVVAPTFTAQPTIAPSSGAVGQVFTGSDGSYSAGTVSARQWYLGGNAISGATGSTYTSTAAGSLTFRVTVTNSTGSASSTSAAITVSAATSSPTTRKALVDFSQDSASTDAGWNKYLSPNSYNLNGNVNATMALLDSAGAASGWTIVCDNHTGCAALGSSTGNNSGAVPDNSLTSYWHNGDSPGSANAGTAVPSSIITVSGLNKSATYSFDIIGSRAADARYTAYAIGGVSQTQDNSYNTSRVTKFSSILPDSTGKVQITWGRTSGSVYGYINTLSITETVLKMAQIAFGNDSAPATAGWNVFRGTGGTASAATGSTIALNTPSGTATGWTLVKSTDDSGSNYTGANTGNNSGVYPDSVMSNFWFNGDVPGTGITNLTSKLTVTGLTVGKTYTVAVFGSRGATDRATTYTVNGVSQVQDNSNNTSRTSQFTGVAPDSSGNVVFTYTRQTGAYGYLSALVVTEN